MFCAGPLCLPARAYHPCESPGLSSPTNPTTMGQESRTPSTQITCLKTLSSFMQPTNLSARCMVVRAARFPPYLGPLGRLVWFSSFIEQCDFPFLTVSTPRGGPHSPAGRQHERRRKPFISLQRTELLQGRKEVTRTRGEDEGVIEHNLLHEQVS